MLADARYSDLLLLYAAPKAYYADSGIGAYTHCQMPIGLEYLMSHDHLPQSLAARNTIYGRPPAMLAAGHFVLPL